MEYLSNLYRDESYSNYIDTNPHFSIAVVSSKKLSIAEGLSGSSFLKNRFSLNNFSDIQSLFTQKIRYGLPEKVLGILKSNWCSKHLSERFSCVIYCLDWDKFGDTAIDELWLSDVCNQLKEYMRQYRSKIIIALVTEKEISKSANSAAQIEKLQYDVKMFLGSEFKNLLPLYLKGLEKSSVDKLSRMIEEISIRYHKEEIIRIMKDKLEHNYRTVRLKFKVGWHYLVLKDISSAKRNFEDAYNILRELSPSWPSIELRLCGTILIFHIIRIASKESSILFDNPYYKLCEEHISWVEQAFRLSSIENKSMSRILKFLIIGECYTWLYQNTHDLPSDICNDILISSLNAFENILNNNSFLSNLVPIVNAPTFVGSECCLESHNCILSSSNFKRYLLRSINELMSKIGYQSKLSLEAIYISTRANFYLDKVEEASYLFEKIKRNKAITYRQSEDFHKLLINITKNFSSELNEKKCEEAFFSFSSLCFGPSERYIQREYRRMFSEIINLKRLGSIKLSYPRKGYYAPFTVLCSFEDYYHDCSRKSKLNLTLFTNSFDKIILDFIFVKISRLSSDGKETLYTHLVSKNVFQLSVNSPHSICLWLKFDEPGFYYCSSVLGQVKCADIILDVEWHLDNSLVKQHYPKELELVGEILGASKHKPWIYVIKPVCKIDMIVPNSITGIEGEEVVVNILIKTEKDIKGKGCLELPYIPNLYEFASNTLREKRSKPGVGHQKGYLIVVLNDLPPISHNDALKISVNYRCLRAGKYIAPIFFNFKSDNYSDREILKKVQVNVLHPFSPIYSIMKIFPWMVTPPKRDSLLRSEITFGVPEISRVFVDNELSTLVAPRDSMSNILSNMTNIKDIKLYSSYKEKKDSFADLNISKGEDILIVMSMRCEAFKGLKILSLDVICTNSAELLSLTSGTLPCYIEYLDTLTISAKIRLLEVGKFSIGFLRILLTTNSGNQRIVYDFPLPEITVEDSPLLLSLKSPSTVTLGSPFTVSFDVLNKTEIFQNCELTIEINENFFLAGGRTQWSFCLSPNSSKTTELLLQSHCVGTLRLPSVFLRYSSCIGSVASVLCQSDSQKVCVLPS